MPEPSSPANDPLSDLESFVLIDRLVDERAGGSRAHAGKPLPDEEPGKEYPPRPSRRSAGGGSRGKKRRTAGPDADTGEDGAERPA